MTEQEQVAVWAEKALQVQDACNLSGVVNSFAEILNRMCELNWDTDKRNRHPVCQMFADKIASLAGTQNGMQVYHDAYRQCRRLVEVAALAKEIVTQYG